MSASPGVPTSGGDPAPDDVDRLLRTLEVEEKLETARRRERTARVGMAVMSVPPAVFLVQALIYWTGGWPRGGWVVLVALLVWPAAGYGYWRREKRELERLERKAEWLETGTRGPGSPR